LFEKLVRTISFSELIERIDELPYDTWIHASKDWDSDPLGATIYLSRDTDDPEEAKEFEEELGQRDISDLLSLQDLQAVVEVERRIRPNATLQQLAEAIDYYREYDCFRD